VRGQRHALATPYPQERPGTYFTGGQQVYKLMQIIIRQYYYTGLQIYFVKESILFGIKVKCLITFEITHIILVILQEQYPFCITAFS